MSGFRKASRSEQYLRMAIQGASGSGKTRSALEIAKYLAGPGGQIALIDTEQSAALYSNEVDFDIDDDFGPLGKESYHQDVFKKKIIAAVGGGYNVVVLDSATHLWKGPGGFLAQIEAISKAAQARGGKYDSFAAWKTVDPLYMSFMQFIRKVPIHVIFCIRAKTEYEKQPGANGKGSLVKVGLSPEYRENFEYEFDIQCAINMEHEMVPLKHRLDNVLDGKTFPKPGKDFADLVLGWLSSGAAQAADAKIAAEIEKKLTPAKEPEKVAASPANVDVNDGPPGSPNEPDEEREAIQVEAAPQTERQLTNGTPDPVAAFVTTIEAAQTLGDLKNVAGEIKTALADKVITQADYNNKLSPVYSARNKAIKAST